MKGLRILLAGLLCVVLVAQQAPAPPAQDDDDIDHLIRATVNIVVAPTTVTDKDGNFVNGLQPHEFRLYDNETLQDINEDIAFQPLSMVIAIQANHNVDMFLPKIQKIGSILESLVVGEQGEVAIVAFDHRVQVLQDFTTNLDEVGAALQKIRAGSTSNAIIDAVNTSANMLRRRANSRRKVIVLISETRQRGSEGRLRNAVTNLQLYNISLYSVNINRLVSTLTAKPTVPRPDPIPATARRMPPGAPMTPTHAAQVTGSPGYAVDFVPVLTEIFRSVRDIFVDNPVEVFTRLSGGREYSFVSQRDLERAIADIGEELHSQYLLSYNPNNKIEGGFHKIRVEVNRPNLNVRTRDGYWLAAVPD